MLFSMIIFNLLHLIVRYNIYIYIYNFRKIYFRRSKVIESFNIISIYCKVIDICRKNMYDI